MKNNYLFKFLKVVFWPVLFGFGQIFILFIFTVIYNSKIHDSFDNDSFNAFLRTEEYTTGLNNYINNKMWLIVLITLLIFLPIFYFKYKKCKQPIKLNKNMFYLIVPSMSIAVFLNIVIININNSFGIQNLSNDANMFLVLIFSSGIVGPILEEFLFRGIVFNDLKQFLSNKKSLIVCTLIFALFHQSISQIMYAFILGYIYIKLYDKTNNLVYPMISHILSNSIVVLCNNFLISLNITYSLLFASFLLIIFILSYMLMNKKI